jgi:DNA-binding beta-propeller fold protein YncE
MRMVQAKTLRYELAADWEQLPSSIVHHDVAGVAVDSHDRVFLFCRGDHPVLVYNRDGTFVTSWGEGQFTYRTHGITIGPDDSVYCVDDADHTVRKYTSDGQLLLTLGTGGQASDTGYSKENPRVQYGGPPFNRPTNLAVAPNGELFVSDGYGNARVHRFSASGELLQSWGQPGTAPGQFNTPHGIWVHPDGRVFVCDRENDRLQIFSPDGEYLQSWTDVRRPTQLYIDREGITYVAELAWHVGDRSAVRGAIEALEPGRVSVYDPSGAVLARWGSPDACAPGSFAAPHSIGVDSHGDIYVAEVTWTFAVQRGLAGEDCHTLQKFTRE